MCDWEEHLQVLYRRAGESPGIRAISSLAGLLAVEALAIFSLRGGPQHIYTIGPGQ